MGRGMVTPMGFAGYPRCSQVARTPLSTNSSCIYEVLQLQAPLGAGAENEVPCPLVVGTYKPPYKQLLVGMSFGALIVPCTRYTPHEQSLMVVVGGAGCCWLPPLSFHLPPVISCPSPVVSSPFAPLVVLSSCFISLSLSSLVGAISPAIHPTSSCS